jgi:hypothetical protein
VICPVTDNIASCEIHTVIHFFHARNMSAVEIHHEFCTVYSHIVMSERTVRNGVECSQMGEQMFTT